MGQDYLNKYTGIKINGVFREGAQLLTYAEDTIRSADVSAWEKDIFLFIKEWLNTAETVTAHTSGSTGKPKEIILKKEAMIASASKTNVFFKLHSKSTALLCLSASYIAGKMMIVRAFVGGFNLLVREPSSRPLDTLSTNIDFVPLVPMQVHNSISDFDKLCNKNISVIIGGGALSREIKKKLKDLPENFYETYGMTETVSHVALKKIDDEFFHAMPGVSFSTDERGCLMIEAPDIIDDNLCTNDIVYLENDKQFRWEGRFDNVINSGGVKIMPEKVESAISELFQIPIFVSPVEDIVLGEKLILMVEEKNIALVDLSKISVNTELTKYEIPKEIRYVEEFPYTNNKIDRIKLRSLIQ